MRNKTLLDTSRLNHLNFDDLSLQRKKEVLKQRGTGDSTLYAEISQELFTRPIKYGPRCSVWPKYETAMLNAAKIAGVSEEETRALVKGLEQARASILPKWCRDLLEGQPLEDLSDIAEINTYPVTNP